MMFGLKIGELYYGIDSGSSAIIRWQYIVCWSVIALVPFSMGGTYMQVELRKEILSHYNKSVAPGFGESTDIGFILGLSRIRELDESAGTLTVEGILLLFWMDKRLSWTGDNKYSNITWTTAMPDDIWTPKINVFNSGRAEHLSNTDVPVILSNNGKVMKKLTAELHPVCEPADLRWYPADTHTCTLSLGALYPQEIGGLFDGEWQSRMEHGLFWIVDMEYHQQWDLLKMEHRANFVSVSYVIFYPTDDFIFTIRRQGWPLLGVILPLMVCCIFLSWSSFALPLHENQLTKRISITTLSLLMSTALLLLLIKTVPGVGQKPPIIIKVNVCIVAMAFFASLHTVVFSRIRRNSKVLLSLLQKLPGPTQCLLGLNKVRSQARGENGLLANAESPPDSGEEHLHVESNMEDVSGLVETAYDRAHLILQINVLIVAIAFLCLL